MKAGIGRITIPNLHSGFAEVGPPITNRQVSFRPHRAVTIDACLEKCSLFAAGQVDTGLQLGWFIESTHLLAPQSCAESYQPAHDCTGNAITDRTATGEIKGCCFR
uniref:Uncharacterized protein n=1 Tax=Pseudomonas fluorescens (strain SBW25) TaxID=216595 RepID=A4V7V6_PSEFS|nr:hypothetical protein pQBR0410 [Pseudomonas fluorescens SBW25]